MPDVDDAIGTGVGALEAGVMRLYGVVMILGGWVRWVHGRLIHVNSSYLLAAPPGDKSPNFPAGAFPLRAHYLKTQHSGQVVVNLRCKSVPICDILRRS